MYKDGKFESWILDGANPSTKNSINPDNKKEAGAGGIDPAKAQKKKGCFMCC